MAFVTPVMGVSSSPLSITLLPSLSPHRQSNTYPQRRFSTLPPPPQRRLSAIRSSPNNKDPRPESSASRFLDERGVVDDMAGYLNDLSLEYDSVWDTKPSWCQPWTISLTGVLVTAASWLVLRSPFVTVVVLLLICAWWYIFLYSYPKAYSEMISERRRNVKNGMEDTFGL